VDQSSPFFLFNAGEILVDNAVHCLLLAPNIPEIFVVKFKR